VLDQPFKLKIGDDVWMGAKAELSEPAGVEDTKPSRYNDRANLYSLLNRLIAWVDRSMFAGFDAEPTLGAVLLIDNVGIRHGLWER
jgi:hypothetical protein